MTDRKVTCVACKSAVTKDDIEQSDLEFDGVLKATNQPEYTADADTDLVATVGTLDEYTPMVRTTGNQVLYGTKTHLSDIWMGDNVHPDSASLVLWASAAYRRFRMRSNVDDYTITPNENIPYGIINFSDKNDQTACNIQLTHKSTGGYKLEAILRKTNGEFEVIVLGESL